jgi:hypothetical protein
MVSETQSDPPKSEANVPSLTEEAALRRQHKQWLAIFIIFAMLTPVLFVLITGQVWEDYLITFRHSKNLADGNGLVFQPGERVHGFTSPLGVLLPAVFQMIVRSESLMPALNMFRALSLLAFVGAGSMWLWLIMSAHTTDRLTPLVFAVLFVTEAKSVAYSMNGQETALMLFFITLGFYAAYRGIGRYWLLAAVAWAGLSWTRPDGCVFSAALALVGIVMANEDRKTAWRGALKSVALSMLIYAPWVMFAWVYYGTPIPHTVTAKGAATFADGTNPAQLLIRVLQHYPPTLASVFQPIYYGFGGWPRGIVDTYGAFCGIIASIYWAFPSVSRLARMASLAFALTCFYLAYVDYTIQALFPWYQPPVAMLGIVVVSLAIYDLVRRIPNLPPMPVTRVIQLAIAAVSLYLFTATIAEIRIHQKEIEYGTRAQVGLYLREHAGKDETVYLEPLGYVGYYSGARMLDWPGLVAPRVVEVRKRGFTMMPAIPELKPDWLVLRAYEQPAAFAVPYVRANYRPVASFDATPRLQKYDWFPGRPYADHDAKFTIFKRISESPPAQTQPASP